MPRRLYHLWKIVKAGEYWTDFHCKRCNEDRTHSDDGEPPFPYADGCPAGDQHNSNGAAYEDRQVTRA